MYSVHSLGNLSFIYKELYRTIAELRPSIEDEYQRIHDELDRWEWDVARDCDIANREIRSTMVFVGEQLDWIDQQQCLSSEQRLFMIATLYRLIYSHANCWYVLIDGVIFEGLVETLSEILIRTVAAALQQSELDILSDLIEPLTDYQYKTISSERQQSAQDMLLVLQFRDQELHDEARKFVRIYSGIKEYQLMFNELHGTFFQPLIPRCHQELVGLIEEIGIRELSDDDKMPWNFMPLLWEDILPSVLARNDSN